MYKHILVPTDGSRLSLKAAREAALLARGLKARITAVYVSQPYMPPLMSEGMTLTQSLSVHQARYKASTAKLASAALRRQSKSWLRVRSSPREHGHCRGKGARTDR